MPLSRAPREVQRYPIHIFSKEMIVLKRIATSAALAAVLIGSQSGSAVAQSAYPPSDTRNAPSASGVSQGNVAPDQWKSNFPPSEGEIMDQMRLPALQRYLENRRVEPRPVAGSNRPQAPAGGSD